MIYGFECFSLKASVPLKEHLVFPEETRDKIYFGIRFTQLVQVIRPELIFDEEYFFGLYYGKESFGIRQSIHRQVNNHIGGSCVLTHLITRRREERKHNFMIRVHGSYFFHYRESLFVLAKRCRMEPYRFIARL
jgi:hypothetical protein